MANDAPSSFGRRVALIAKAYIDKHLDAKLSPEALGALVAKLVAEAGAERDAKLASLERRASRQAEHIAALENRVQKLLRGEA